MKTTISKTTETGRFGEDLAAKLLRDSGYEILERNYRAQRYEIDIIARDGNTLVFVEVKTGKSVNFGEPETWVDHKKQYRIGLVASCYLQEKDLENIDCRFDVVAVKLDKNNNTSAKHIQNAFWLEDEG